MWKPLLFGAAAMEVRATVEQIARELATSTTIDPGSAALFWAYYGDYCDTSDHEPLLERALQACLTALGDRPLPMWLHGGSLGLAWTVAHVLDDQQQAAELLSDYDRLVLAELRRTRLRDDHDVGLISGVAGVLVYATERAAAGDRAFAAHAIELAMAHLHRLSVPSDEGVCWRVPFAALPAAGQAIYPHGLAFCGPGHGVAGVIAAAARAHALGLTEASALITRCESWLATFDEVSDPSLVFPYIVTPDRPPVRPPWLAWCSGTLSSLALRWEAAIACNHPIDAQLAQLAACALAEPATLEVADAALCHGALGHAVLFQHCWVRTGVPAHQQAAMTWLQHADATREVGGAFAGFTASNDGKRHADPGLLGGAVGVALGYMAASHVTPPAWLSLFGVWVDGDD